MVGDGGSAAIGGADGLAGVRGDSPGARLGGIATDPIVQCVVLLLGVSAVFAAFPIFDIWVSELFALDHVGFPLRAVPAFMALGHLGPSAVAAVLVAMVAAVIWKLAYPERPSWLPLNVIAFLLVSLVAVVVLTPILMLAAASMRLPPFDIDLFGGHGVFVPLWQTGGGCTTSCAAFSSATSWAVWLVSASLLAPLAWRPRVSKVLAVIAVLTAFNVIATGEDYWSGVLLSASFAALVVAVAHRVIIERPAARVAAGQVDSELTRLGRSLHAAFRDADWDAVARKAQAPWRDRRAQVSPLKAVTLALVVLPAAWLGWLTITGDLTPLPWVFLIYNTGIWALWLLLASLAVTPARHIFGWPQLIAVRRMLGVGGLFYTVLHVADYLWLDRFSAGFIVNEYLTRPTVWVATVATAGMVVLGATSFDESIRRMGSAAWTRLHLIAYPAIGLSVLHFAMSPASLGGPPYLMTSMFLWLMAWRVLALYGLATKPVVLLALGLATPVVGFVFELTWLALFQHVPAGRTIEFTFDLGGGLAPSFQMLIVGLTAAALAGIFGRHTSWRGRLRLQPPADRAPLPPWLADAVAKARGTLGVKAT